MSTVTENDLKRLEDLIIKGFETLGQEIKEVKQEVRELDIKVTKIETKLSTMEPFFQKIPDLAEKVGELKNWNKIAIGGIGALIGGFLGFFIRGH